MNNDIPSDVRERILTAANTLAARDGRIPTVDAVRRAARADMNAASVVMRDWRRDKSAKPKLEAVGVPERIAAQSQELTAALWTAATSLAGDALQAAQSAWTAERADLEALRAELAAAFEVQAAELEAGRAELAEVRAGLSDGLKRQDAATAELVAVRAQLDQALAELAAERQARMDAVAVAAAANARAESADAERQRLSELVQTLTSKPAPVPRESRPRKPKDAPVQ